MAEHTHTLTSHLSAETIWDFVRDMDRWAPFMLGYQGHEQQNERESRWTLKADLGNMTRTVNFQVKITEWKEPERILFTLEGIREDMRGDGLFQIEKLDGSLVSAPPLEVAPPTPGFLVRFWSAIVRRLLGRNASGQRGRLEQSAKPATVRLTFRMSMTPGGAMAPMLDAMIKPVMVATAEHLAEQIIAHLEAA
jgi:carbon monoxide dehydrogenase subunit G